MSDPNAFTLLMVIAFRARFTAAFTRDGLKPGEALVGDYDKLGMSRQVYRDRLAKLKVWGFVTTRLTNRGTIARLIAPDICEISIIQAQPTKQPSSNHRTTTNSERLNAQNEQRGRKASAMRMKTQQTKRRTCL